MKAQHQLRRFASQSGKKFAEAEIALLQHWSDYMAVT